MKKCNWYVWVDSWYGNGIDRWSVPVAKQVKDLRPGQVAISEPFKLRPLHKVLGDILG